jgi:hypothetical protein
MPLLIQVMAWVWRRVLAAGRSCGRNVDPRTHGPLPRHEISYRRHAAIRRADARGDGVSSGGVRRGGGEDHGDSVVSDMRNDAIMLGKAAGDWQESVIWNQHGEPRFVP